MTAGMFTSVFSGSGVVMPSTSGTLPASTTSSQASATTSVGNGGQQSGDTKTSGASSNAGIIGGVVAGVVVLAALAFFLCWFLRRRRRRAREAEANRPGGEGPKPQMGQTNPNPNPNMPGYNIPYNAQYPYTTLPQIQEHDPRDDANIIQPYVMPMAGATHQSYDSYSQSPAHHGGITVHAPAARPLSNQSIQSITYYGTQSSDRQSPSSNRFSQNTATTAPLVSNDARSSTENRSAGLPWNPDRKERVASPPLPLGAMPPGSPSGSSMHPWSQSMSPPPRSLTGTALPPYETGSQYQGSIRE
ncbi:hypothetical protein FRC09_008439 [Ceratobasidium sp. 395]|nr:hypothetical protein FRC09_008439 [Ceratobasidium sp. 395]